MLMLVLLAGAGSVAAENLARRVDSARTLRLALIVIAVGFVLIAAGVSGEGSLPSVMAGVAIHGLGLGANDAASNLQAVALEHRLGRPVMPSFHAAWTAGGLLATGLAFVPLSFPAMVAALTLAPLAVLVAPLLRREVAAVAAPATSEQLGIPGRASCSSASRSSSSTWSTRLPPRGVPSISAARRSSTTRPPAARCSRSPRSPTSPPPCSPGSAVTA
jgi:hypothetical protein